MSFKIILTLLAFTFTFAASGQDNSAIDSLKNILKTASKDTTKVNNLNILSNEYLNFDDYENSMRYADSAILLAKTLDHKNGIASAYARYGWIYGVQGKFPEALEYCFAALKINKEIEDKKDIAWCYSFIGYIYREQGNFPEALENYTAALNTYKESGEKKYIAQSYYSIGLIYVFQSNLPKALENNIEALKIYKEIGDKKGIAECYHHIGGIYYNQGDHPEALENFLVSLKISEEEGYRYSIAHCKTSIGNVYYYQGNHEDAMAYYSDALKIHEEFGNKRDIAFIYNNIGIFYTDQGKYQEALDTCFAALKIHRELGEKLDISSSYINIGNIYFHQGNYDDARKYLNEGLALSKEIGSKMVIRDTYSSLSQLDSVEGNFAQAREHYRMSILYRDSIVTEEIKNQMALLKVQYETEMKDREIELLNKDNELQEQKLEKQTLIRNGLIAGVVFIVLLALLIFRSFRLRKKLEKQDAIINERHRISADLHDDVGSGLSKITLLSELLKTQAKTPENRKEAEKISDTALEVSSTISEIIWALNSNNDYLENMVAYIRRYAAEYFENSPVKLKITTQGEILPTPINGEHRRNIFYTVKEALNNILKHAEATEAELKFVVMNDKLDVIISDNGKGIPDGDLNRFGNGINNMRARMKSISGVFKIENHHGTRILLKLAI